MVPFSALWLGLSLWLGRQYARRERAVPVALLLAVLALGTGRAAGAQARHGFVFVRGADTMGTEVVTAARAAVLGDIRMTGQPRMSWRATLGDGGVMQGLQLDVLSAGPGEGRVLQRVALRQEGDTVVIDITAGSGTTSTQRIASQRGAFLLVNASAGMLDLLLARAAATPAAVDTIPVFLVGGGVTMPSVLSVRGDSASWQLGGSTAQLVLADGRVQEVRLPAQDFRMRRVPAAEAMAHAGAAPDYRAPAGAPYTAENVRIPATGGHELAGTFTRPRTATGRLPAVVTITGSGAQDRDEYINMVPGFRPYRQLADTLGHHGFAVLRYDDRGFGESGGSFSGSTSRDFADDVRSAIRWLRQRPDIDPARIFLVGHSEGGMIAPMVAADDPTVAGIVLLGGPAKSGLAIIRFQQRYAIEHSPEYTTQAQRDSVQRVSEAALDQLRTDKWLDFFLDYDPLQTARRVRVPTFVVQGATDQQVTPEQAAMLGEALRAGGNGDVTVTVFADRNHLFLRDADGNPARYNRLVDGHVDAEVMGALVDWLAARAARAGGAR